MQPHVYAIEESNGITSAPMHDMGINLTQEEYTLLLIDCLEHLRGDIVIHRLTGDGPSDLLLAPDWSRNKRSVLNGIHSAMKTRGAWQGRLA